MHDELERILAGEEHIAPSPKFLASVMAAVEREAAAPAPIAFPWLRALPGLLAMIAAVGVATWRGIDLMSDPNAVAALGGELRTLMDAAAVLGVQWIALAAAITIVSVLLPLTLTRGRLAP